MPIDDRRQHSPAAERNRGPILDALKQVLPPAGAALEIASGTGQHAVHFAAALPRWTWQPTDRDPGARASVAAWAADAALDNLAAPLHLDVTSDDWPVERVDAIFCANMIHIAPWAACLGLIAGAARHLAPGGLLILYGPFIVAGEPTAASNLAFDADLRARDPAWGLRELEQVADLASRQGLALAQRFAMPANNQLVVFRKGSAP
jgi:SAM-dependent methyltransferase